LVRFAKNAINPPIEVAIPARKVSKNAIQTTDQSKILSLFSLNTDCKSINKEVITKIYGWDKKN
jgi:hypothetical protein